MADAIPPRKACLFDAFLDVAVRMPDRLVVSDHRERLTYREVEEQSAAIASQLVEAGLGPGSRVALYVERGARHLCNLLGVFRAARWRCRSTAPIPTNGL